MAVEIVMPRMGLTMEEGTVLSWHKQEGEPVQAGEILLEIETDKVSAEIEAKASGVLGKILVEPGVTVPIGTPIATILETGETQAKTATVAETAARPSQSSPGSPDFQPAVSGATALGSSNDGGAKDTRPKASPAARRAARELNLELQSIRGHGPGGRILESDVQRAAQEKRQAQPRITPVAARMAAEMEIDLSKVQGSGPRGLIQKSDLPAASRESQGTAAVYGQSELMSPSRAHQIMAERMAQSFSSAPHFYLMVEANAAALVDLRQTLLPKIESKTGVRLSYTDLLAFFLAAALSEHEMVNAAWAGGQIRLNRTVNLGIAVDSEQGLIVPVIHGAERLSLSQIAQQRAELVEKARTGKLGPDDLAAGTFTLSNLGAYRVDTFNAVLNPPQAAILAVGRIHEKVIPVAGQAVIQPVMGLSLTCDHRVIDGATGARFLDQLVELIEEPYTLFA
jgi:pyruvate dehydrogenase E2 component (dihydrolipoamide acetyltransferase)